MSSQNSYGGGYGQMPSYGGMRGPGMNPMPTQIGRGYQKPMMQPQAATRAPMQQSPQYQGNPNDVFGFMRWQQEQAGGPWGGQQNQQYDPNPNISGTQAVPWYESYGFGPRPASTVTPGRYHGFAGSAFDDQGNVMGQQPRNPYGTDFNYWYGQR